MSEGAPLSYDERKFRAKRYDEGLKLGATFFNPLSIVTIGTAFVGPITQGHGGWASLAPAVILRFVAQARVRLLRQRLHKPD
jgi:hypothetical protein